MSLCEADPPGKINDCPGQLESFSVLWVYLANNHIGYIGLKLTSNLSEQCEQIWGQNTIKTGFLGLETFDGAYKGLRGIHLNFEERIVLSPGEGVCSDIDPS